MNKKASMQLGINAIVVLIIALAILGLAMSFITNLFKSGEGELKELLNKEQLKVHADSNDPFVFDPSEIVVKAKKEIKVVVVVFNELNEKAEVSLELDRCIDDDGDPVTGIGLVSFEQDIESGEEGGFKVKFVAGDVDSGSYICKVNAILDPTTGDDLILSQQMFIDITR
ncbi:MAG: hypothetical protein KKF46_03140 [Nanoarchaeota archaeon]|nr:hypothetical protein [Nanoarchaeota archaeon]MBU1321329.1 hypothetical protein [Nanoarchaeota archaeon]MBU1597536.1 hypothetical protein [Nanoarchaeota archaeon]MBU2441123.1 hypothetical protein [Nanoarchaeota archaeon]